MSEENKKSICIFEVVNCTAKQIYDHIDEMARSVNLSVWKLCIKADVDPTTVNKWSLNKGTPSFGVLRKLIATINAEG